MALKKGTYKVPKGPKKILNKVSQKNENGYFVYKSFARSGRDYRLIINMNEYQTRLKRLSIWKIAQCMPKFIE